MDRNDSIDRCGNLILSICIIEKECKNGCAIENKRDD